MALRASRSTSPAGGRSAWGAIRGGGGGAKSGAGVAWAKSLPRSTRSDSSSRSVSAISHVRKWGHITELVLQAPLFHSHSIGCINRRRRAWREKKGPALSDHS